MESTLNTLTIFAILHAHLYVQYMYTMYYNDHTGMDRRCSTSLALRTQGISSYTYQCEYNAYQSSITDLVFWIRLQVIIFSHINSSTCTCRFQTHMYMYYLLLLRSNKYDRYGIVLSHFFNEFNYSEQPKIIVNLFLLLHQQRLTCPTLMHTPS